MATEKQHDAAFKAVWAEIQKEVKALPWAEQGVANQALNGNVDKIKSILNIGVDAAVDA